jgi:hypothetical protein
MDLLALEHDWEGYAGAGTALAFGALGVIAGVRLLGLTPRGLALDLAWVGILMWLAVGGLVAGPHRALGPLAIYVLGVAGPSTRRYAPSGPERLRFPVDG